MSDLRDRLEGLDSYIESEMQKWHVPGMAVAVIHDGEVIHQRGYGTRNIETGEPVTPETLFAIGSCTKAFTTMGLALLVEDGKLDWDTPIREYMPQFRLHDSVASEQMTARDLVCHRSGLPRHDFLWYGSSYSRWQLFERLRHLKPSFPFRYTFQYQNLMYMVAGCLIETISGQTWETFTQERIFDVIGMDNSLFSVIDAEKAGNAAKPHECKNDEIKRIPFRNIDAVGPAGSIHSNLPEMLAWLTMHMNNGEHNGKPFISEENLKQMHQPHVTIAAQPPMDFVEIQHNAYGLGWSQHIYRGHVRIRHTGGIDGFITDVSFMPHDKLGVIVFNNGDDSLSITVAMHIYDRLLGLSTIDWRERYEEATNTARTQAKEAGEKIRSTQKTGTTPTHDLEAYAGEYEHPGYGTLTIKYTDDGLLASFNSVEFALEHLHYNTFLTRDKNDDTKPPICPCFCLDAEGNIAQFKIQIEPAVDDIVFTRKVSDTS